jgi:hypothetical protein
MKRLVKTGEFAIGSGDEVLFSKSSQCVLAGLISNSGFGLAHISNAHFVDDFNSFLNTLKVKSCDDISVFHVVGGAYAFVQQYGPIWGNLVAERLLSYLSDKGLSDCVEKDCNFGPDSSKKDFKRYLEVSKKDIVYKGCKDV